MSDPWHVINIRRQELSEKLEETGLNLEEEDELEFLQELLNYYVEEYLRKYPMLQSDMERLATRNGLN